MIDEHPTLQDITPQAAAKIQAGQQVESLRLREVDQMPASWQAADIHYRAMRYGALRPGTTARCPCCNEKVDVQPFTFFDGTQNPLMHTDIILFFSFIRTLIIYLVIHLLISDLYNLMTNMAGEACGSGHLINCPKSFLTLMATTNKIGHKTPLQMLDIFNLVLVLVSILYFAFIRRVEYQKYNFYENELQTEDDFAVFVTGIPILLYDEQRNKMTYSQELRQVFTNTIQSWLQRNANGSADPTYLSYVQMAQRHGHHPSSPPRIVVHVDLCWNLTELNNYSRNKEDLKDKIEAQIQKGYINPLDSMQQRMETVQRLGVTTIVNTQYEDAMLGVDEGQIDLCTKYDLDRSFNFCMSRFIGKAFVTFEYQHFLQAIIDSHALGQTLQIREEPLGIHRATHPADVYWENLHYSPDELKSRRSNTFWITAGCLVFSFCFVLLLNWLRKYVLRKEVDAGIQDKSFQLYTSIGAMLIVSVFVALSNWALHIAVHALVGFESHESSVDMQRAYVIKTLIAQFINTAISFCLVSLLVDKHIWSRSGIIMQTSILFMFTAVIQIIANLIYFPSIKRHWQLSNYNRSLPVPRYQDRFNKEYALPEFDLGGRFAYYLLQLFLISFFCYVIPLCVPLVLVVFVVHYYIDRINLFYRSSMNENYTLGTLRTMYKLMESSVLIFAVGNTFWSGFFGISPWRPLNVITLCIVVFYVAFIWLVPFAAEVKLICYHQDLERVSYDECNRSNRFEHTYRLSNPATNLFHQGRMNYAFDTQTQMVAAMSANRMQASGAGMMASVGGGIGLGGIAPMTSSIGGTPVQYGSGIRSFA